jgi:hypothetical protein
MSEPESPQGEWGARRAGRPELARAGLSEERALSEPESAQGEWGARRARWPEPDGTSTESYYTESYNPWSVVNLVFHHLADQGLHPVLGSAGDPGPPATALLRALGIEPAAEGNKQVAIGVRAHLAEIRAAVLGPEPDS